MLNANFQIYRPSGFGEDFLKAFAIHSPGGHLGHVYWIVYNIYNYIPLLQERYKFGFDWPIYFKV